MRIKKMFEVAMMLSLACLLFVTSAASAKTTDLTSSPKLMNCFDVAGNVTYKTAPDGSITKIIEVQNVSEFSEQTNLRLDPDSKVTIYIPDSSDNDQPNYSSNNSNENSEQNYLSTNPNVAPFVELAKYIANVSDPYEACGSKSIRDSDYDPPGGKMVIKQGIQATHSTTVSIDAKIVSTALKYDVTASYAVEEEQNIKVPDKKRGRIIAYPKYDVNTFEIWEAGLIYNKKIGDGTAFYPKGVCFVTIIN